MALSVLSKVALCVCPPVAMATAVATVPPVKRAVHHATAKPTRTAAAARAPARAAEAPCIPGAPGYVPVPVPAVPLVTFAEPGPSDLPGLPGGTPVPGVGGGPITGGFPPIAVPIGPLPGGTVPVQPGPPGATPTPTPPPNDTSPVPEPATWAMMIGGMALAGAALRRRRGARAVMRTGGVGLASLLPAGAGAGAGEVAGTLAAPSIAAAVTKAALCVCPPALLATAAVTVPPVRDAVHAATAPILTTAAFPPVVTLLPCPEVTFAPPSERPATPNQVALGRDG